MTDDHFDDDIRPSAFDGLDLESLTDDVRPTSARWLSIESAARRRAGRRTWLISAAAALLLIVAVTGLLLVRDDSVDVATGSPGTEDIPVVDDLPVHLVPPTPFEITDVTSQPSGTSIAYRTGDQEVDLAQYRLDRADDSGPRTVDELAIEAAAAGMVEVDGGPRGLIWVGCTEASVPAGAADPRDTSVDATATWIADGVLYRMAVRSSAADSCARATQMITAAAAGLKEATLLEWRSVLATFSVVPLPVSPLATTVTTAVDGDPPADLAAAEEQITAAVSGLATADADGSYPHLEDGVALAETYRGLFTTAAEQAGADQIPDRDPTTFEVTSIRFVSPDEARIEFDATAPLPSGTFTFANSGRAVLRGGRWVVSYDTVTAMLGRACTPPGGASASCSLDDTNGIAAVPGD